MRVLAHIKWSLCTLYRPWRTLGVALGLPRRIPTTSPGCVAQECKHCNVSYAFVDVMLHERHVQYCMLMASSLHVSVAYVCAHILQNRRISLVNVTPPWCCTVQFVWLKATWLFHLCCAKLTTPHFLIFLFGILALARISNKGTWIV